MTSKNACTRCGSHDRRPSDRINICANCGHIMPLEAEADPTGFKNVSGEVLSVEQVEANEAKQPPSMPDHETYTGDDKAVPRIGSKGILYMNEDLNYTAVTWRIPDDPNQPDLPRIQQVCLAGDREVGGHISTVKTGIIVEGPEWSFRIGARTEDMNEEKSAPEPEWAITVVEVVEETPAP